MARLDRLYQPDLRAPNAIDRWAQDVTDAVNLIPNFSIISTVSGPESYVTADPGVIAFDIGSSVTRWWGKYTTSGMTGWVPFGIINTTGVGGAFSSAFAPTEFF